MREREDDFAFRFTAYLFVGVVGNYTFYTSSDDGSQLFIGGALVVDNDGLHAEQEVAGSIYLQAGYHEIIVTMFEAHGGQALVVSWNGPANGGVKEQIPSSLLFEGLPPVSTNSPPVLASPDDQSSQRGDAISLDLNATDDDGDFLYFDAAGLPEGLSIDYDSGRISGRLSTLGTSTVTASASDGPAVSVVSFEWSVGESQCGDGITASSEECDDGNTENGDGCSSTCEFEGMPGPDGGVPDGGVPDGGMPTGGTNGSSGGGCTVQSGGATIELAVFLVAFALVSVRRRRR